MGEAAPVGLGGGGLGGSARIDNVPRAYIRRTQLLAARPRVSYTLPLIQTPQVINARRMYKSKHVILEADLGVEMREALKCTGSECSSWTPTPVRGAYYTDNDAGLSDWSNRFIDDALD